MSAKQKPKKIKHKTKSALTKRIKVTGTGKWKIGSKNTSHLFTAKSTKTKRHNRKGGVAHKSDMKRLKDLV